MGRHDFLPFWQISTDGLLPRRPGRPSCAWRRPSGSTSSSTSARSRVAALLREPCGADNGRDPTRQDPAEPRTPVLQVNLIGDAVLDSSADRRPAASGPVGMKLRDLPDMDFAALQTKAAKLPTRTWRFERGSGGWTVKGASSMRTSPVPPVRQARKTSGSSRDSGGPGVTRCTSISRSIGCCRATAPRRSRPPRSTGDRVRPP